eukprot:11228031-Lingulodinium_polyedra.AAC.1
MLCPALPCPYALSLSLSVCGCLSQSLSDSLSASVSLSVSVCQSFCLPTVCPGPPAARLPAGLPVFLSARTSDCLSAFLPPVSMT